MKYVVSNKGAEMPKKLEETVRANLWVNLWLGALLLLAMCCSVLAQPNKSAPSDPAIDVFTLNNQADTFDESEPHEIAILMTEGGIAGRTR